MSPDSHQAGTELVAALTREHQEVDAAIDEFATGLAAGELRPDPLVRALAALRRHIYLEEEFLFPPIQGAGMVMPIQVMLHEHGHIWRLMDTLDGLVVDATTSRNHDELMAGCQELLALLDQHNNKEEPIVYPRAGVDLPSQTCDELTAFLDNGRAPDGWICQALGQGAH